MNDNRQSQFSRREQLKFILVNSKHLLNVKNGAHKLKTAKDLAEKTEPFTKSQMNLVDILYEDVMKGAGYESFHAAYKPKKGLRF